MNLASPFINRPVMTTFVMLAILISGWMAFQKLRITDLPSIEHPRISVSASYTGANSETVLNLVTTPLEKELIHVKGLKEISSISSTGNSHIGLKFELSKNMNEAVRDVQTALNRAEGSMPKDLDQRPTYDLQQESQECIMYLLLTSDNATVAEMRKYADAYIVPRLSRIEGTAQIMTFGGGKSIWLRLNPELMASRQIGFNQVVETVEKHTSQAPMGSIQTGSRTLAIEISGELHHAKDLEQLKIGNTEVRLKDIGEVVEKSDGDYEFHFVTPQTTSLSLIMGVRKISDGNTVAISKAVEAALADLKKELPPTMHLDLWFNKAIWIEESIREVEWSLGFAFILVFLVIYFSLGRISEALITSTALPMSLIGTFSVMYLLDFSLDILSLLALTLAVGFVVDDAIVVLENIVRYQEKGAGAKEASLKGSKQIGFTILSMTLSLVAVFIPLLFMGGMNGRLFREFSITLSIAILISGFISIALTPMLCSRFLRDHSKETKMQKYGADLNSWMVNYYKISLSWCFHHSKFVFLIAILCVGLTAYLFPKLPVQLIPPEDRGFIYTMIQLPSGISKDDTKGYQSKLNSLLQKDKNVANFLDIAMEGNLVFFIRLYPFEKRLPQAEVIKALQKSFDEIPGIQAFIQGYQLINLDLNFSSGGQYSLLIRGFEFEDVENGVDVLLKKLQSMPEVTFSHSSLEHDSPKLIVHVNDAQAHRLGLSKKEIQTLLQSAYSQASIGSFQKASSQEKIFMELQSPFQDHVKALSNLYLTGSNKQFLPLKAIATWEEKLGSPSLVRREQLPASSIRFSLTDTIDLKEGLSKIEQVASEVLPSSVTGVLDGHAKNITSALNETLWMLLAASIVMYIVLGILYESFIHPLTILSSLPFAGLGGILTLYLFGEPITIFSAVGFLVLIGIVKKNGIMMVDYALEAKKRGLDSEQAILEGCVVRFRPIMMTTFAAIMGALPIAIGFGDGAGMRRGLGLVIAGGLLFAQLLTLFVTPIIFLAFEKLQKKASSAFYKKAEVQIGS